MAQGKTVRQVLRENTTGALREWMAYWRIEPFGEAHADYRSAIVAATVFNTQVAQKDRQPVDEFMPYYPHQMAAVIERRERRAADKSADEIKGLLGAVPAGTETGE